MTRSRRVVPTTRRFRAYVDGGCHPNPEGTMGVGVVLEDADGTVVREVSERPPGLGTNNEAEYRAVLRALVVAAEAGARHLEVRADSRLTVNTLSGHWRVKAANLQPLKRAIDGLLGDFDSVVFRWIPREQNKRADALATKAIGGDAARASKYGTTKKTPAPSQRPKAEGALCGGCKKMCRFEWQVFANGTTHVRQTCPQHGFLRYTPREKVFLELAGPEPRAR